MRRLSLWLYSHLSPSSRIQFMWETSDFFCKSYLKFRTHKNAFSFIQESIELFFYILLSKQVFYTNKYSSFVPNLLDLCQRLI